MLRIGFIVIGILVLLWLIKAPIMSVYMTREMGVEVTVGTISMRPKKTMIRNFRVANPRGFKSRTAFAAKKTDIDYRLNALFSTPAEIDQIVLDDVDLYIELRNPTGSDNNWAALAAQIPSESRGREVIIHKLIIRDMTVEIRGVGAKVLGVSGTRHLAQLEFNEINSKDGFPTKELVTKIFEGAGLMKYLNTILNPVRDVLKPFHIFSYLDVESSTIDGN